MPLLRELKRLLVVPSFAVLAGRYLCLCCLGLAVLPSTPPLLADVTGSILGYVRDSSGGVLPKATLTLSRLLPGYTRTAIRMGRVSTPSSHCLLEHTA